MKVSTYEFVLMPCSTLESQLTFYYHNFPCEQSVIFCQMPVASTHSEFSLAWGSHSKINSAVCQAVLCISILFFFLVLGNCAESWLVTFFDSHCWQVSSFRICGSFYSLLQSFILPQVKMCIYTACLRESCQLSKYCSVFRRILSCWNKYKRVRVDQGKKHFWF